MNKGEVTKQRILDDAMAFVCRYGLTNISIGEVAKRLNMSRTGVISHFADKQDMQIAILRYSEQVFIEQVLKPSFSPDPETHLRQFVANWVNWVFKLKNQQHMSCPFVKAVAEFQDREESLVKSVVREQQQRTIEFLASIVQRGIDQKSFGSRVDPHCIATDIVSFYLGHNISKHLLADNKADARFAAQISTLLQQIKLG